MTRPDRNDIERMLAAGDAPKPPEGLLERLHADIPEDLATGVKEEKREISFWRQGWLAAASLIAVVGMGYVMLRVFDTPEFQNEAFVAERATAPSTETSPRAEALSEFDADAAGVGNELGGTAPAAPSSAAMSKDFPVTQVASDDARTGPESFSRAQKRQGASRDEEYRESFEVTGRERVTAAAPAPAALAPPPPPAAAQAEGRAGAFAQEPANDRLEETRAERSVSAPRPTPALAARTDAAKSADRSITARAMSTGELVDTEADPVSTFGLRLPDSSWALVSSALMNGRLPVPESVRPEELINYFRYSDTEPARGEVTLRTEGAESPMRADASEHLLRVGVRVSSNPDLAVRGAKMQVEFNPDSVEAYRLVGYEQNKGRSAAMPQGDDLAPGHRVTALYEVRVGPEVATSAQVGTVRLQYETGKGEKKEVEQVIRKSDMGRSWSDASRDLQLAGLVSDWASLLQRRGSQAEAAALGRRAAAVSGKWEGDRRVAELVDLIRATAELLP